MKLNNKGMTLIEIIISIALISIVLIFIFSLLITVNQMNSESKINSNYLITKALTTKVIEDDLINSNQIELKGCGTDGVKKIYSNYGTDWGTLSTNQKAGMCLELTIKRPDNPTTEGTVDEYDVTGYLAIYYYKAKGHYVITYIVNDTVSPKDSVRHSKELPDFENYNTKYDGTIGHNILNSAPSIIYGKGSASSTSTATFALNTNTYHEYTLGTTITLVNTGNNYAVIKIPVLGTDNEDYTFMLSYYAK